MTRHTDILNTVQAYRELVEEAVAILEKVGPVTNRSSRISSRDWEEPTELFIHEDTVTLQWVEGDMETGNRLHEDTFPLSWLVAIGEVRESLLLQFVESREAERRREKGVQEQLKWARDLREYERLKKKFEGAGKTDAPLDPAS